MTFENISKIGWRVIELALMAVVFCLLAYILLGDMSGSFVHSVAMNAIGYLGYWAARFTYESWEFNDIAGNMVPIPIWIPQMSFVIGALIFVIAVLDECVCVVRGGKPSYKVGEFLGATLSVSAFGTAFCYYEDANRTVARIFPNQFHPDSVLKPSASIKLADGGFRIRFDDPGRERVACIGSDQELVVPSSFRGSNDLTPIAAKSLDDVITQFRQNNAQAVASVMEISVSR